MYMASTILERRLLRRIPMLRDLSSRELDEVKEQMIYRSYEAGEVIWRTRGPLRFSGYIQSGEIELEYRGNGFLIRTSRLGTGDPLPPRRLRSRRSHETVIARAITDVRLKILPEPQLVKPLATVSRPRGRYWLWPVLLLLLAIVLAREDIARIASGLLYLSSAQDENAALPDVRSISLLEAAQKVEPRAAFAYNEEGYRWFQQNHKWDAAAAFDAALTRDPASASALNNRGITYSSLGDLLQAAGYLRQAVGQDPNNAITHYNLGILLMQLKDLSGAIHEFREAGFIDPKAASPPLQEAYLYQQMGDYADAEQRARTALQLDPSLAPAQMLLGIALYNQGRETEALTSFMQTLSLQPGNRTATFYRALILGHLKQSTAAVPILQELLVSSTDPAESARIQAEIDALYHFQADATAARR
jgi:tetratricopeptide (TPR) repeat protein